MPALPGACCLSPLINLAVVAAFRLPAGQWDWRGLFELTAAAVGNGLLSITITRAWGFILLGALFGMTTTLQLLEISRPTHPLLRQLLLKAPGTYHHTLIVSNMSERAAEAIGADALLTRVGAYYHDVGKTIRPYFFVENRTEGMDPHARLDPYTSAQIIVTHVRDGIDLARKYRLPRRIIDFIPEHQGTLLVSYFYHQAVQQAGRARRRSTRRSSSIQAREPQSRETAITMLADGAEATVRSRRPASVEELEQIVGESIQSRMLSGQLDECPLTLADLAAIRRAFVDVLRGLHHPRVAYPGEPKAGGGGRGTPGRRRCLRGRRKRTGRASRKETRVSESPSQPTDSPPSDRRRPHRSRRQGPIVIQVDEEFAAEVDPADIRAAVAATLAAEGQSGRSDGGRDDGRGGAELNEQYRDTDGPTDVLSFPAQDPTPGFVTAPEMASYLGDIIIALPYTRRQAAALGRPLGDELRLLAVHGALHLLGYDHAEPEEEAAMWARQGCASWRAFLKSFVYAAQGIVHGVPHAAEHARGAGDRRRGRRRGDRVSHHRGRVGRHLRAASAWSWRRDDQHGH